MKKLILIPLTILVICGCGAPNYSLRVSLMSERIANTGYDTAKTEIMAMIDEYPEKPEPYYFLGIINFNAKKYADCIANFDEAERRKIEMTPDFHLQKGIALYQSGDTLEAQKSLNLAQLQKQSGTAQKFLGMILYDLGDYAGSAAAFGKAGSISSDRVSLYKYGMALYNTGMNAEALEILLRAYELSPGDDGSIGEKILFHTANLLLLDGQTEEAVRMYTEIPDGSVYAPESIYNSAEAFIREGQLDTAADLLKDYVTLRPDDNEALLNLSSVLIRTGKYVAAADILSGLIEKDYGVRAFYNYGVANHLLGKYAESVYYLAKTVELIPDNIEYLYAYGITLTEYGDIEKARAQMEAVAELKPGHEDAAEWLNQHLAAD